MNRRKISSAFLRWALGLNADTPISLGLPAGSPCDGEEDIVLYVDVDEGGATAGEAKPTGCEHGIASNLRCYACEPG